MSNSTPPKMTTKGRGALPPPSPPQQQQQPGNATPATSAGPSPARDIAAAARSASQRARAAGQPIPAVSPARSATGADASAAASLGTSAPLLREGMSFLSGPHVITVERYRPQGKAEARGDEPVSPTPALRGGGLGAGGGSFLDGGGGSVVQRHSHHCSTSLRASDAAAADLEAPLLAPPEDSPEALAEQRKLRRRIAFAQGLSWVVNIALLAAKIYAFVLSGSKAVMASAADSAVDLVSQVVISYTEWQMHQPDERFPVGQARLEALGVLACSGVMAVASFQVVAESCAALYDGFARGTPPELELGLVMYAVLGVATALKLVCFVVCNALKARSDSMVALAEDHLNDIASNLAAIGAALLTALVTGGWWLDPTFAVIISVWIMWRWFLIARAQVHKLVGRGAPADFIEQLRAIADEHHEDLTVDVVRAYHFGTRYLVEMEVVLPAAWTLRQSHDVAMVLQHKVEALEDVERAFVHVDYTTRDYPEHKVERALGLGPSGGSGTQTSAGGGANSSIEE